MTTLLISDPHFLQHETLRGHPERADRVRAIEAALRHEAFASLVREEAPAATIEQITRAHPLTYVQALEGLVPAEGHAFIDADTSMSPGSFDAAMHAAGAACRAVDAVIGGEADNAFAAIRPPGHHAEATRAMGFCLFNNAAIAARHAQAVHGVERVAIVDFDVHHGNGTQQIFWSDPSVLYASTHEMPLFPGTGSVTETGVGNIVNAPLRAGDGSEQFKQAMRERIFPAIRAFRPGLLVISAGFDAHRNDPLANIQLDETDFMWVTDELMALADETTAGRIVSLLEGGYDLAALAHSTAAHVLALMDA